MPFMFNRKTLYALAVPAVVVVLGAAWLLDFRSGAGGQTQYETSPVTRGQIRRVVTTSGPVRALVTVSIGSQLSGQVREVKVDFNSEVRRGDELAVLDDKTFASKVVQARADVAAARAALVNQEAGLTKAEATARAAERSSGRQRTLAEKGVASSAALDNAIRDIEVARAEIGVAKALVEASKAAIEQKLAVLQQAELDLDRTRIRSPIDGTVISRTVDIGQTVAASLQAPELFKIAQDLRHIRIEAQVNEADVGAVAEGNPVTFTVDAYPERKFEGRVAQVRLAATELQSVVTYTVIISAENADRRLFPGMTANVQIETDSRSGALRVSNDALRFRPRDRAAPQSPEGPRAGSGAQGQTRFVDRLKDELQLSDAQAEAVTKAFADARGRRGEGDGRGGERPAGQQPDPAQMRQRIAARLEQVLGPTFDERQRALFDRWKAGRENTRSAVAWVLTDAGTLEARQLRVGISDDQFSEVVGGRLAEGDKVVVRAREAKK